MSTPVDEVLSFLQQPNDFVFAVFDDGDEKTLRRSSLCLKGARHFAESEASGVLALSLIAASFSCFIEKA